MIKNNKGVTLVELLIVIVVMGIIAAFAIPAVGTIIDNTQKDSILADAIQVENAANLYCAQTTCSTTESLSWAKVEPYIKGIPVGATGGYEVGTNGVDIVAVNSTAGWTVTLEAFGTASTNDEDYYEWPSAIPSASSRTNVAYDEN